MQWILLEILICWFDCLIEWNLSCNWFNLKFWSYRYMVRLHHVAQIDGPLNKQINKAVSWWFSHVINVFFLLWNVLTTSAFSCHFSNLHIGFIIHAISRTFQCNALGLLNVDLCWHIAWLTAKTFYCYTFAPSAMRFYLRFYLDCKYVSLSTAAGINNEECKGFCMQCWVWRKCTYCMTYCKSILSLAYTIAPSAMRFYLDCKYVSVSLAGFSNHNEECNWICMQCWVRWECISLFLIVILKPFVLNHLSRIFWSVLWCIL